MATSAISNSTPAYQPSSQQTDFRQQFGQLVAAIKSGDLSGAQQAYADLSQLQSSGAGPAANASNPVSKALNQIGQALQGGDISGAQQALAALSQQAQGAHHGHHHHGGGKSAAPAPAPADAANSTASARPGGIDVIA